MQGVDLAGVKSVNQMAVTRDYNKPLQEEEPYLVQVLSAQIDRSPCRIKRRLLLDYKRTQTGLATQLLIPIEVILLEIAMKALFRR